MSLIKSPQDIQLLRTAGRKLATVLHDAKAYATIGMSLIELDTYIEKRIHEEGCRASFKGFEGFPNSSCLSLNEQVVHGIPDDRILQEGDLLGIDVGLWLEHVCVDSAITVGLGKCSSEAEELLKYTEEALYQGIDAIKPFRRVGSISYAVESVARQHNLGIVRALTGHGVGHHVHEDPEVPNLGRPGDGALLRPGMVIAIEPMFTTGGGDVLTQMDGWGVVTADSSLSAQFEHTVVITKNGAEILTTV